MSENICTDSKLDGNSNSTSNDHAEICHSCAKNSAKEEVTVIGAGLAGSEAAYQIACRGIPVCLIDMKPKKMSPAHHNQDFAELVCSNSLRSNQPENASGLLKEEMRKLGSLIIKTADETALPAGNALAVDRELFAKCVTDALESHPLIKIVCAEITDVPDDGITVLATGPLTSGGFFESIEALIGRKGLHFYDAAAPIITADSIDMAVAFRQSRYDKGGNDYINCPLDKADYQNFYRAIIQAETADMPDFDRVFEACMPIETLAMRGEDAMRYGPLRPVGLRDPHTSKRPYAVVQLRQDNFANNLYNIVGFQTRLKFHEQKRIFRMIPGLSSAEFARYGVMHRNTFIAAPRLLAASQQLLMKPRIFFAGQITGVEGYMPSAASGLIAGINAARVAMGKPADFIAPRATMLGALMHYVAEADTGTYQPMNANFGLLPLPEISCKKNQRKMLMLEQARSAMGAFIDGICLNGYN